MSFSSEAVTKPVRGAYLALALLFFINMLNYIDRNTLAAVGPVARHELMPNDENALRNMGILFGSFMVTYMLVAPIFGWLSDRYSRWKLVAIGITIWSFATFAGGFAVGFWSMLLCRCLVGVGEAAYGPAAPAILADLFPIKYRGKAIAVFYVAIPVGSALAYVVGGFIQQHWGWRYAFYFMLPPGLLMAILCFFMREPKRGEAEGKMVEKRRPPSLEDYKLILRTKSFIFCTLGMTAMTFALGGIVNWMPEYMLQRELGPSALIQTKDGISQLTPAGESPEEKQKKREEALGPLNFKMGIIIVIAGLLSTLAGGWLADILRKRVHGAYFLVSGAGMFVGFGFFLSVLFSPLDWAWYFLFLAVFCLFLNTGPTNTILTNVIHPMMRQMAVALNIFIIHAFGDVISPTIIGWIAGPEENLHLGFLIVSGMILLSGVFWWLGGRYLQRDTELAPTRIHSANS
jgi:MFS family permease